ncbi:MAG: lipoyl(octanoyl) transferase LipB [Candidatus Omnitrophota bacterium]
MIETSQKAKIANITDLGLSEYQKTFALQKDLLRKRISGAIHDTVIITEHAPVFTIGRLGSKANLLAALEDIREMGIELIETDRGGDITYHGPGQLVIYPIIDLRGYSCDIRVYIKMLEEVILNFLLSYGIEGFRVPGASGVWVDNESKIASVGISITRWVAYHGISVNVDPDLKFFDMITPCGLKGCKAVSIASLLNKSVDIAEARKRLTDSFEDVFRTWRNGQW